MTDALEHAILDLARRNGKGVAMGAIVDTLEQQGHAVEATETMIWSLLQRRLLTPSGFVCRTVRRHDDHGDAIDTRMYDMILQSWSPAKDVEGNAE